ncbi:hypothetical protein ACFE04_009342 [Oxalis oulophora]
MTTDLKKAANAAGGKTARACDSCMRRRARWYCVADDAFLCQSCDVSVHSANQLASRHERIRLETSSSLSKPKANNMITPPSWHQGFTRKARTPRNNNNNINNNNNNNKQTQQKLINHIVDPPVIVPELNCELDYDQNEEEQLLYRVPVFSPFEAELCNLETHLSNNNDEFDSLNGLFPSDMDLADFAADVENLLGGGDDIQNFKLVDDDDEKFVKVKEEEEIPAGVCHFDPEFIRDEALDWSFDESPLVVVEEEKVGKIEYDNKVEMKKRSSMFLRLNHEAVIAAWASQGCPWMAGSRPEINPDDDSSWPEFMATRGDVNYPYGGEGRAWGHAATGACDGDREARVSRYREKRRTRLFSKKIRYEVRKLNAEKRPRMKGRFVKRSSFAGNGTTSSYPYFVK